MPEVIKPATDPGRDAAAETRREIEAVSRDGETVVLPKGKFSVDRSIWAPVGPGKALVIIGQGEETVLFNGFTGSPYMMNNCVTAHGSGVGWADSIEQFPDGGGRFRLLDPDAAKNYKTRRVCFLMGWSHSQNKMDCLRRVVSRVEDGYVYVDEVMARQENVTYYAKWTDGEEIADVPPDADQVVLEGPPGQEWTLGQQVLISGGPCMSGYEFPCEYRKVAKAEGKKIWLDWPLARGYQKAVIVPSTPALVRLENLTLGPSALESKADPLVAKFAQLDLRNVHSRGASFASCGPSTVADCRFNDWAAFNSCDRVRMVNGYHGYVAIEEGCLELRFENLSVGPGFPNGFYASTPDSQGVLVKDCRVYVAKPAPGVNAGMPVAWGGKNFVVENLRIQSEFYSYLGGEGLRVRGLRSAGPVVFCNGKDMALSGVRVPDVHLGWWANDSGSGGTLSDYGPSRVVAYNPDWNLVIPLPAYVPRREEKTDEQQ